MTGERWALAIDVEGFRALWPTTNNALQALSTLMETIHAIGCNVYPDEVDRLFAHQYGDGFFISSDFHEPNLERATTIAIALMKCVALRHGIFTKAAITEGETADITGCYPKFSRQSLGEDDTIRLGSGRMTIFPVMGTGLINAVSLSAKAPGPLLLLNKKDATRIPESMNRWDCGDCLAIDWLSYDSKLLNEIQTSAGIAVAETSRLRVILQAYLEQHKAKLPHAWVTNASRLLVG